MFTNMKIMLLIFEEQKLLKSDLYWQHAHKLSGCTIVLFYSVSSKGLIHLWYSIFVSRFRIYSAHFWGAQSQFIVFVLLQVLRGTYSVSKIGIQSWKYVCYTTNIPIINCAHFWGAKHFMLINEEQKLNIFERKFGGTCETLFLA